MGTACNFCASHSKSQRYDPAPGPDVEVPVVRMSPQPPSFSEFQSYAPQDFKNCQNAENVHLRMELPSRRRAGLGSGAARRDHTALNSARAASRVQRARETVPTVDFCGDIEFSLPTPVAVNLIRQPLISLPVCRFPGSSDALTAASNAARAPIFFRKL